MSKKKKQEKLGPQVSAREQVSASEQVPVSKGRAGGPRAPASNYVQAFEKIYRVVLRIPRGRVMTYGQIARLLEDRYSPRLVGWAMHATPQDDRNIPWHRVINSRGGISTGRVIIQEPELQRWMLEAEGILFDERGHCDLSLYQWSPVENKPGAKRKALAGPGAKRRGATTDSAKAKKKKGWVKKAAGTSNRAKKLKKDS
jgi:methylated-DNA-protein-cysteine methyltransferase related protein